MEYQILILFALIGVIGSFVAGLIRVATKWQILEWYQLNRYPWMPNTCIFCLAFWLSCLVLGIFFWVGVPFEYLFLLATISSASVAQYIVESVYP